MFRTRATPLLKGTYDPKHGHQVRFFWEYVNMMFNKPDPERLKIVGADRACAEWVLRNGGAVKWSNGETLNDYNFLPDEGVRMKIAEIDGSNSSISHYGFPHLTGCENLKKIVLHNNRYIEDRALEGLSYGRHTLQHIQVSHCINVTDAGLRHLHVLKKLQSLSIYNLQSVENLEHCGMYLKSQLPNCEVQMKSPLQREASNGN